MIFGLDGFTLLHIAISLFAIGAGFIVVGGLLANVALPAATLLFLATSMATSATGFLFPFPRLLPSHIVGAISLVVLLIAAYGYYIARLEGVWCRIFTGAAIAALYLNVFVLIAQTFLKNPALASLAPTQSEPPFLAVQAAILIAFALIGYLAFRRFTAHGH